MKQTKHFALVAALLGCLCAASDPSQAAPFDIFAAVDGQGADPIVDPYPFFIFPDNTKTALIIFQSDNYAGVVTLNVSCCEDIAGNTAAVPSGVDLQVVPNVDAGAGPGLSLNSKWARVQLHPGSRATQTPALPLPPGGLKPNQFVTDGHEAHRVGLSVTTTPSAQVGLVVATVTASKSDGSSSSTKVKVNVLPALRDSPPPRCAAFATSATDADIALGVANPTDTLIGDDGLGAAAPALFDDKTKKPSETQLQIADAHLTGNAGEVITLSKSWYPLMPNQALFYFYNPGTFDRQYVLFDTTRCMPTGPITLKSGERQMIISDPSTDTILFRLNSGKGWENLSIMSGPSFWTVFGQKEVDFRAVGPFPP